MTEEWDTAEAADKKDVTKFLSDTSLQVMNGLLEHALVSQAQPGDSLPVPAPAAISARIAKDSHRIPILVMQPVQPA